MTLRKHEAVTMVRGRGYVGGWVPYVTASLRRASMSRVRADALVTRFYRGETIAQLARGYSLTRREVEEVLRWESRRARYG